MSAPPDVAAANYITPAGYRKLVEERDRLWHEERPKMVETVAWAAGNGDRSENGDYIYGKKRLREIDRRLRFLRKRIDAAVVVGNEDRDHDRVFFGATVTVAYEDGRERTVVIVGADEIDPAAGRVSMKSPVGRALMNRSVGDEVLLRTPAATERLEVLAIRYDPLP